MATRLTYETIPSSPQRESALAVLVIGTGLVPAAGKTLMELDTPHLLHSAADFDTLGDGDETLGTTGTLLPTIRAIYDAIPAPVVAIRIDGTLSKAAPVGGTVAESLYALKVIEQIERWSGLDGVESHDTPIGVRPTFAVDSGLAEDAIALIAAAITQAYATEAGHVRGVAVFGGGPTVLSTTQYGVWYATNAHAQTGRVLPLFIGSVTDTAAHSPAGTVVGAILRSIRDNGIVENPSLKPVFGISTFTPQFIYASDGDSPADAAAFPASGSNSTILIRHRGGILTYGMEIATTDDEDPFRYLSTRLVGDIVDNDANEIAERYNNRPATVRNIDKLSGDLFDHFEILQGQGLIRRGTYLRPNAAANTPAAIAAGVVTFTGILRLYGVIEDINMRMQATLRPA